MKIVLTGIGGQGVVFLSRLITMAAQLDGKNAISAETHGMARRGASVISFVKIGEFLSPLIGERSADIAFCFRDSECARAVSFLRPGSQLFMDSSGYVPSDGLASYMDDNRISVIQVPATATAEEAGSKRGANLYLLGVAAGRCEGFLSHKSILDAVDALSPHKFRDLNKMLIGKGLKYEEDRVL